MKEIIEDILREMRNRCIDEKHSPELWKYLDRIETAYKKIMDVVLIAEIESNAIFQITAHPLIEKKSKKIYNACVSITNKENNNERSN